jgi:predicted RNA-binding protein with PUA-like domain
MYYLLKTEPTVYSYADLEREKTTVWDGVTNPTAVRNLREMPKGSEVVIYHTGDERRTIGTASVVSVDDSNPKVPIVTLKAGKALKKPKSLDDIKAHKVFSDSPLVRIGRLSVVPLTKAQWDYIISE